MSQSTKSRLIACRAVGGVLRHLRLRGKWAALCGHSPQNTGQRPRADWHWDMLARRNCKRCFEIAARQGLELPVMIQSDNTSAESTD